MDIYVRERVAGKGGGGGGAVNAFCVCVELEDWASEKLSGRVQLEDHPPKWRALRNFSFQPCCTVYIFAVKLHDCRLLAKYMGAK